MFKLVRSDSGLGAPTSVRGSSSAEYLVAEGQPEDWGGLCGRVAPNLESPSPSRWLEWWLELNTIIDIVAPTTLPQYLSGLMGSGSSTKGGPDWRHRPPSRWAAGSWIPMSVNERLPQALRAQKY